MEFFHGPPTWPFSTISTFCSAHFLALLEEWYPLPSSADV